MSPEYVYRNNPLRMCCSFFMKAAFWNTFHRRFKPRESEEVISARRHRAMDRLRSSSEETEFRAARPWQAA